MAQLNNDVLHDIFDHLEVLFEGDSETWRSTARAVCLASRQLRPFGQRLLYNSVATAGPQVMLKSLMLQQRPSPGAVFSALSSHRELGELVEKWGHYEYLGHTSADDVLDIEKLDELCPSLRTLEIVVLRWSEGGGEASSSHLRRQVRALSKPSCALAGRLRSLSLNIIDSSGIPTIKLGKLLSAAVQLQVLVLSSFALGGFPRSATGPPSLTILHAIKGDVRSFIPLIQGTPALEFLKLSLGNGLDPRTHGVEALSTPHVGVDELSLSSHVQRPGSVDDTTITYQNINAFIACFPNVTSLRLVLTGDRMASTGVDLDKVPRCLTNAVFGFDDESIASWDPADTAGPTASELEAWIQRGGAPRLQKLNIGRRATLEGVEGPQKLCDERGVVLQYELA